MKPFAKGPRLHLRNIAKEFNDPAHEPFFTDVIAQALVFVGKRRNFFIKKVNQQTAQNLQDEMDVLNRENKK